MAIIGRTIWQGERDNHAAVVCTTGPDVVEALEQDNDGRLGWLAKQLLAAGDIDATVSVDEAEALARKAAQREIPSELDDEIPTPGR